MSSYERHTRPGPPVKGRVLLVDDEEPVLRAHARLLGMHGYTVTTTTSGSKALELLATNEFDIVMSDLTMPEMTGIELLRAMRAREIDLPFVVVTAAGTTQTAMEAMEHGAIRYLLKPLDQDLLGRTLEEAMKMRRRASEQRLAVAQAQHQESRRQRLARTFEGALEQLYMVYQPIVRWSDKKVYGYEALVRSTDKELPHPGALFDAAEELGEVHALGRAIRKLIPEAASTLPDDTKMFVNLHTRDLADAMLFDEGASLSTIAPQVVLEITERASLGNIDDPHARVSSLRHMGFRIALDDIGAGYAGLTSFALLEPDVVKLDMALVRDIDGNITKQKLVSSLVSLCNELDIALIAEGVETGAERDTLIALGVDLFQGYLFAKPQPPFCEPKF